jgi:uncharacterized protein YidB (DUF937 family)
MSSIFDAIAGALNEAMQQQKAPGQPPQSQMQPQSQSRQPLPDQVQTGQPGAASYTSGPSFIEILEGSGLGNLEGLVKQLSQGGLDQHVQSWLGKGENMPVNSDQLRGALGDQHVQNIGEQAGVSAERILQILAQYLPAAIDQASPNGKLQDLSRTTH